MLAFRQLPADPSPEPQGLTRQERAPAHRDGAISSWPSRVLVSWPSCQLSRVMPRRQRWWQPVRVGRPAGSRRGPEGANRGTVAGSATLNASPELHGSAAPDTGGPCFLQTWPGRCGCGWKRPFPSPSLATTTTPGRCKRSPGHSQGRNNTAA